MKKTITEYEFIDTMTEQGNGFTYDGAKLLFDYLEMLEEDCGTEIDFDPIAFRCDFSEYCAEDYINKYYINEYTKYCEENELETADTSAYKEFFDYELNGDDRIIIQKDSDKFIINTNF